MMKILECKISPLDIVFYQNKDSSCMYVCMYVGRGKKKKQYFIQRILMEQLTTFTRKYIVTGIYLTIMFK